MAKALAQADKVRTDAETHAKELLSNARKNADRVVAEAREHAEKQISDAMTESERERTSAARQVEDLNRQRESITSYLDELRNLLGHNPDRATLERASRAEAAFQQEQKKATVPTKGARRDQGLDEKPSTKPARRRPARPSRGPLPCRPLQSRHRRRPDVPAQGGPSEEASPEQVNSEASADSDSHDDQNAGKDDATAPSR